MCAATVSPAHRNVNARRAEGENEETARFFEPFGRRCHGPASDPQESQRSAGRLQGWIPPPRGRTRSAGQGSRRRPAGARDRTNPRYWDRSRWRRFVGYEAGFGLGNPCGLGPTGSNPRTGRIRSGTRGDHSDRALTFSGAFPGIRACTDPAWKRRRMEDRGAAWGWLYPVFGLIVENNPGSWKM